MNCLFCNIASGAIPATIIYRNDTVVAFDDINPQAPIHKIIIPIKHIETVNDFTVDDSAILTEAMQTIIALAKAFNIAEEGYRVVMNCNANGGQSVFHIHWHLLGGRRLQWPPG